MTTRHKLTPRVAAFTLLVFCSSYVFADKPVWIPIAELLVGSMGEADPVRMSDVMTRCTALNMTLSGMASDISPDMAQHYQNEALRLIQHGVLIDSNIEKQTTGMEADIAALSNATIEKLKTVLSGYSDWLDDNIETGGSYFDDGIELEMTSCELATKLVDQLLLE